MPRQFQCGCGRLLEMTDEPGGEVVRCACGRVYRFGGRKGSGPTSVPAALADQRPQGRRTLLDQAARRWRMLLASWKPVAAAAFILVAGAFVVWLAWKHFGGRLAEIAGAGKAATPRKGSLAVPSPEEDALWVCSVPVGARVYCAPQDEAKKNLPGVGWGWTRTMRLSKSPKAASGAAGKEMEPFSSQHYRGVTPLLLRVPPGEYAVGVQMPISRKYGNVGLKELPYLPTVARESLEASDGVLVSYGRIFLVNKKEGKLAVVSTIFGRSIEEYEALAAAFPEKENFSFDVEEVRDLLAEIGTKKGWEGEALSPEQAERVVGAVRKAAVALWPSKEKGQFFEVCLHGCEDLVLGRHAQSKEISLSIPSIPVNIPPVNVPQVNIPPIRVPQVNIPPVNVPQVSIPPVQAPQVNVPPGVAAPAVAAPGPSVPPVPAPGATVAPVPAPGISTPPVPGRSSEVRPEGVSSQPTAPTPPPAPAAPVEASSTAEAPKPEGASEAEEKVANAKLLVARNLLRNNVRAAAIKNLQEIVSKYPRSKAAQAAKEELAKLQ